MTDGEKITRSVESGLGFLRRAQLPHGEFQTLVGGWAQGGPDLSCAVFDSSPFVSSFVIYALTHAPRSEAAEMIRRAVAFLRADMGPGGHWRYWSKAQHKHYRLPPDLDDTACASFAIKIAGNRPPRNTWVFRHSRDDDGRFLTWLSQSNTTRSSLHLWGSELREAWARYLGWGLVAAPELEDPRFNPPVYQLNDVDPVVNANVALYLGEKPETKAAIAYVIKSINNGLPAQFSLYYLHRTFLYYAIARAYRHSVPSFGVLREKVVAEIEEDVSCCGGFDNPLVAACSASVLLTFAPSSPALSAALASIVGSQQEDGGWPVAPFYLCWGSRELTTALCLESLLRAHRRTEERT